MVRKEIRFGFFFLGEGFLCVKGMTIFFLLGKYGAGARWAPTLLPMLHKRG